MYIYIYIYIYILYIYIYIYIMSCLCLRMTWFCKLLQLSQISPISKQHSTSRFTGYVYEHVVYWITVFPIKSIHGLA